MADSVLEQIRKQLHQQLTIAADVQVAVDRFLQLLALFLECGAINFQHRTQQVAHVDVGKARLACAALDLSNPQQSAENLENAIDILPRSSQQRTQGLRFDIGSLR